MWVGALVSFACHARFVVPGTVRLPSCTGKKLSAWLKKSTFRDAWLSRENKIAIAVSIPRQPIKCGQCLLQVSRGCGAAHDWLIIITHHNSYTFLSRSCYIRSSRAEEEERHSSKFGSNCMTSCAAPKARPRVVVELKVNLQTMPTTHDAAFRSAARGRLVDEEKFSPESRHAEAAEAKPAVQSPVSAATTAAPADADVGRRAHATYHEASFS